MVLILDLQSVDQFHRELEALVKIGIEIDLPSEPTTKELPILLRDFREQIAKSLATESDIENSDLDSLPQNYRTALLLWTQCGQSSLAFETLTKRVQQNRIYHAAKLRSRLILSILFIIAYFALIFVANDLTREVMLTYQQLYEQPGFFLRVAEFIRFTRVIWIPLFPIVLIAVLFVLLRKRSLNYGRNSEEADGRPRSNYDSNELPALRAAQIAKLNEFGIPNDTVLRVSRIRSESSSRRKDYPHEAIGFYRYLERLEQFKTISLRYPIFNAAIGGLIVLFVGLSIFGPFVELIAMLAKVSDS